MEIIYSIHPPLEAVIISTKEGVEVVASPFKTIKNPNIAGDAQKRTIKYS